MKDILDRLLEFKKWRNTPTSSNVKKMMYNDETRELVVQFHRYGEIYTYFNIPFNTFLEISRGSAVCKTSGESKWGRWWVGKTPSVGATLHQYLIATGADYMKGGTLR